MRYNLNEKSVIMPLELRGFLEYVFPIWYNRRKQVTKRRNLNFMGFIQPLPTVPSYRRGKQFTCYHIDSQIRRNRRRRLNLKVSATNRSLSLFPPPRGPTKLKIGTEKPTNEERGEGREGGSREKKEFAPSALVVPRPHTNSKSCSN